MRNIILLVRGWCVPCPLPHAAPRQTAKRTSRARASERFSLLDIAAMRPGLCCLLAAALMAGCATSGTRPPATAPPPPEAAVEPQDHASEPSSVRGLRSGPLLPRALPPRQTGALVAETWSPDLAAAIARLRCGADARERSPPGAGVCSHRHSGQSARAFFERCRARTRS